MSEFEPGAAVAESPTADPSVDPSAGTQNTAQPTEDQLPFHKHPRWQERTQEIQTLRAQNQQLNQRLQQLEARREQTGQPVSQEEQELRAAREALHRVDPTLKGLPQELQQIKGYLTQQAQAQAQANDNRARGHISELAKSAGLSTDPKFLASLTRFVALEASHSPDADARYNAGDFAVLTEAFDAIKGQFTSTQQRAGITALAASKTALNRLPPRPTGSVPGGVAFTKPQAGDPASIRTARRERHDAMSRMVDELG